MLPRAFYARPTLEVARDLIGHVLVHEARAGVAAGVIVEVEAYIGESDPACHAAPGPTRRNAPLYGPPGVAYVYLNYGMHYLVNAVTEPAGSPAAVLIRALEPIEGEDLMRRRRARASSRSPASFSTVELCRGPGNLTRALGITLRDNRRDLTEGPLRIESTDSAGARARLDPPHRDQRGGGHGMARVRRRESGCLGHKSGADDASMMIATSLRYSYGGPPEPWRRRKLAASRSS